MIEKYFFGQIAQKVVLKYKDSFVIVQERNENMWVLPGGRLNVDENPKDSLLQAVQEELGVDCIIEEMLSVNAYHGHSLSKTPKFFVFYRGSVSSNQEIVTNDEISKIAFVTKKEELEKYAMFQNQKDVIEKFLV